MKRKSCVRPHVIRLGNALQEGVFLLDVTKIAAN